MFCAISGRIENGPVMHAMVLKYPGGKLECTELPDLDPGPGQMRVEISACGVCRTDLHVLDGELPTR